MYHIKNDKRSIQSSEWIFNSLNRLINEKKFEDITITEVVDKAMLGRSTFYRCFDSLEDVLRMKCDETFKGLYKYIIENYKDYHSESINGPKVFVTPYLRYCYLNSHILELLIKINRVDIINDSFAHMISLFIPHLGKTHDIIRNNLDYFIALRTGMAVSVLVQWIKNGMDIPPDDLAELLKNQMKESFHLSFLI